MDQTTALTGGRHFCKNDIRLVQTQPKLSMLHSQRQQEQVTDQTKVLEHSSFQLLYTAGGSAMTDEEASCLKMRSWVPAGEWLVNWLHPSVAGFNKCPHSNFILSFFSFFCNKRDVWLRSMGVSCTVWESSHQIQLDHVAILSFQSQKILWN